MIEILGYKAHLLIALDFEQTFGEIFINAHYLMVSEKPFYF